MKKENSKKIARVVLPTTSVIALAISLPLTLTNLLNNELEPEVNGANAKQLNTNLKANNSLANDGTTNLLPSGSQVVTLPQTYSTTPNPSNWNGVPQKQTLQSNQYFAPSTVNLNVYSPTSIQAIIAIPKEYAENSNFALNFYWTFLGNSKSLGQLKNTDDANPDNRNGLGTVLPSSWVTNKLYKTPNGEYRLVSELSVPQQYAPYFYNEHQSGNWQGMGLDTVAQYFNFILTEGQSNSSTYATAGSVQTFTSKNQYTIRVESNGISSKSNIQFETNLESKTNYIKGKQLVLTVNPYNIKTENNGELYKYKYQWYLNNKPLSDSTSTIQNTNNISGATTNTLTIDNAGDDLNGGSIYCKVIGPILDLGYDGQNAALKGDQQINGSNVPVFSNSNVTTLNQMTDFTISNVNVTVASSNTNNQNGSTVIVPQGQSVSLIANASINPIYDKYVKYQWYKGNNPIQGETNNTLTLNNVNLATEGSYKCVVQLTWNGKVIQTYDSNARSIDVVSSNNFSIQLAFQSSNGQVNTPSSTNLNISIPTNNAGYMYAVPYLGGQSLWGNNKVTYQWYKDGIAVSNNSNWGSDNPNAFYGGNTNQITSMQMLPSTSGAYYCIATYTYPNGQTITATSNTIFLDVSSNKALSIYQDLKNVTVDNGKSVSLSFGVSYDGSSTGINYTWQYKAPNSQQWNTFYNGNYQQNVLNLTPQQALAANGYTFQCQANYTSYWGNYYTTSSPATISVVTPNVKILSQPISIQNARIGSSQTLSIDAAIDLGNNNYSTTGLSYQWCTIDNKNKVSPINGATQETYTIKNVSSNDDNTQYVCYVYPSSVVNPKEAGKLSSVATITILQPEINPSSLTIYGNTNLMVGDNTTLSVKPQLNYDTIPNGYSLSYQWYKSDVKNDTYTKVENGTTQSINITNVQEKDDGVMYWCEVSVLNGKNVISTVKSRPTILNIDSLDTISIQLPSTVKSYVGGNAVINAKVSIDGKEPDASQKISYQWKVAKPGKKGSKELVWEDINQATSLTLNLSNVQESQNGEMYALQVKIGASTFISNFPTTLEVYKSSYVVNLDSTNVIVNEKQTATIKASVTQIFATNENQFKYQWYVIPKGSEPTKDGNGNITNGEEISGATKGTLTLADSLSSWDGAQFYCKVTLGNQVQTSQIATLDVQESKITANTLPYKIVASNGQASVQIDNVKTSFDISGASLHYQWQQLVNDKWTNIQNATSNKLDLTKLTTKDNGNVYRVVVTYSDSSTVYETFTSSTTVLIVNSNVNVAISLPSSMNALINSTLVINPEVQITGTNIQNDKVSYQWQKLNTSNNNWDDVNQPSDKPELSLPTIQSSNNGDQYRLIVKVGDDTFTSHPVTINACQNSFSLSVNNDQISTIIGGNVSATVNVNTLVGNANEAGYTYQWYAQIEGQEPVRISGQTTPTLNLKNVQKNWNGAKFYCTVINQNSLQPETLTSPKITLKVNEVDILNTELPPQVLSNNGSATFTLNNVSTSYNIEGAKLSYQWYVCEPGQDQWTQVDSATSNTLTLSGLTSKDNGKLYKCLIKYGEYASEYTNASILTVNSTLNVDIQMPNQINSSIGQQVVIDPKVQVSGNNLGTYSATYQWQYTKNPSGNDWKDILKADKDKLDLGSVKTDYNGYFFRLIVTINGNKFTSSPIKLNVFNSPFVVNVTSDNVKVNVGSDLNLSVIVSKLTKVDTNTNFTYKWYVVPSNGEPKYVELPSSYNAANITLKNAQSTWNNAKFYCVVSDGNNSVTSDPIAVTINNNTITYDQLPPVTVVNNSKATIQIENVKPGYTIDGVGFKYLWQVNDGKGWKDWTSQTSQTVNLTDLTYLQNGYSFRCQITYGNTTVITNATTLIIDTNVNVNINLPGDVNGYIGGSVELNPVVSITGNNINPSEAKYQWQYSFPSTDGSYQWADVQNGNQKDLVFANLKMNQNNFSYRLKVMIAGQTYTSNSVLLNVYDAPFAVNTIQTTTTATIGGDLDIFTFIVKNYDTPDDEYSHQWYAVKNPSDLKQAIELKGQTDSELYYEGKVDESWNGWYFFCVVTQNGVQQRSQFVQLKVIPDTVKANNLASTTVVENSNAIIEVTGAAAAYEINGAKISYQWQKYNGNAWKDIEGQQSATLSLTGLDSNDNGTLYRCKITYGDENKTYATTYTNATSLVVNSTVDVSITIPQFINTYVDANVTISPNIVITGTNLGLSTPVYQWQKYNNESKTWENVQTNGTSDSLTLSHLQAKNNNDQYRLVVSLNGSKFYSEATYLKVFNSSFAVNVSQQSISTNIGQQFEVSVNVNQIVGNNDTFAYQWYVISKDNSEPVLIQDATEQTLVLKNPQQSWNGAKFFCKVTSNSNKIIQQSQNILLNINECKLNVPDLPTISVVKNDAVTINLGEVTPNYQIGNTQITYQWQKYNTETQKWENLSQQTNNSLVLNNLTYLNNGDMYRCAVYYGEYAVGYSSTTTLVVNTSWTVNIQVPNEVNTSVKQNTTLTPIIDITGQNVGNDSLKNAQYQWQILKNGNWTNVEENGNDQTLTLKNVTKDMNGNMYRLVVSVGGNVFNSNSIKLNVFNALFTVNAPKTLVSTNIGQDQLLTLDVQNTYNNAYGNNYSYQWYYIPLSGADKDVTGIKIEGATNSTLRLTNPQLDWSGVQFYCVVTLSGESQTSPKITLSINKDNIFVLDLPTTVTSNEGKATIKVGSPQVDYNINGAEFKYQWYKLVNGKWEVLDGQTSSTLNLNNLTSQDNGNAYRCEISYTNGSDVVYSIYTTNTTTVLVNASANVTIKLPNQINVIKNGSMTIKPNVSIESNASSNEISYQWQYIDPTSFGSQDPKWQNVKEGTSQNLTINSVPESAKGYYLRLTINVGGSVFTSNSLLINIVDSSFVVNANTTNYTANAGSQVTLSVSTNSVVDSAYTNANPQYKYQWYYCDTLYAGGPNATDDSIYKLGFEIPNQTGNTLTLKDLTYDYNRIRFFCKVTQIIDGQETTLNGPIMSIHVNQLEITTGDMPSIVFAKDSKATLSVQGVKTSYEIEGAQLRYQWYNIVDGEKEIIYDATNSTLTLNGLTSSMNGTIYMCEITYVKGNVIYDTVETQPTSIVVNTTMNVNVYVPYELKAPVGGSISIEPNVDVSGNNLGFVTPTYQWQYVPAKDVVGSKDEENLPWQNIDAYEGRIANLSIPKIDRDMNGYLFRLQVKVLGNTFTSNPIKLKVTNSSFTVNTNTSVINSGIGQTASITVNVSQLIKDNTDSEYTYQWYVISNDSQIKPDGTYNGNAIEGATSPVLRLTDIKETWNNARFYCVVKQGEQQAVSQLVTLNVKPVVLSANSLPVYVNAKNGEAQISISNLNASYNILNTQFTYQWQKLNSNNEWVDVPLQTNSILNLSGLTEKDNGTAYRCMISYGNYASMYTTSTTVIVNATMNVSVSLANQINGLLNSDITIVPNVNINGENLDTSGITYQWKVAKNSNGYNMKFEDVKGDAGKKAQLTLSDLTEGDNGNWYQLVVSLNGNTFTSNPIQLHVLNSSFVVNVSQGNIEANLGQDVTMSAKVDTLVNEKDTNYKYQWFVITPDSQQQYSSYARIQNSMQGVAIPNATNAEFTLNGIDNQMNGAQFYCEVSLGDEKQYSAPISLNVNECKISFNGAPIAYYVKDGKATLEVKDINVSYEIPNAELTYQWQMSSDNGKTWINIEDQTSTKLVLDGLTNQDNGYSYRCQISYGSYVTVNTTPTVLIVDPQLVGPIVPGGGNDNVTVPTHSSKPSAWIAIPIVFGSIAGISGAFALWWFFKKRTGRWGL